MLHRAALHDASVTVMAYINEGEGVGSVAAGIGVFQGGLIDSLIFLVAFCSLN